MERQRLVSSVDDHEQRTFIKFGILLDWSASHIHRLLRNALGSRAYSGRTVRHWVQQVQEGRADVRDTRGGAHHVCPDAAERTATLKQCLQESRAWSLRSLSEQTGIPKDYCHKVLTEDFKMTKKLGKYVPADLSEDQRCLRKVSCKHNLLLYNQSKTRLKRTLAVDETWVSLYRPPEKDQQMVWLAKNETPPKFTAQKFAEPKRMLILALDINGIAFWHMCKKNETVTAEVYKFFLEQNIPNWMKSNGYSDAMLVHDNARPHKARLVSEWLESQHVMTWEHPPHSPDLHPCDYGCFHQLKRSLGGKRYESWQKFTEALETEIIQGSQNGKYCSVVALPQRWNAIVEKDGDYL